MIDPKLFIGKTIKAIDTHIINVVIFYFTDDTKVELEVEALGSGLYGMRSNELKEGSNEEINWQD